MGFAATTFNKVFIDHDEEFLRSNLKDAEREITPQEFIDRVASELGEPLGVGKPESTFTTRLVARRLQVSARFDLPVTYDSYGPIWVNIEVSRIGRGWQIDHIGWTIGPHKKA